MYRTSFIILYYDHQMHNYFTNNHTTTCFDTILSSSGSLQSIPCHITQVFQQMHFHNCVKTCRSVIIGEIIVIVQNRTTFGT
jgi:hypothetical protein